MDPLPQVSAVAKPDWLGVKRSEVDALRKEETAAREAVMEAKGELEGVKKELNDRKSDLEKVSSPSLKRVASPEMPVHARLLISKNLKR